MNQSADGHRNGRLASDLRSPQRAARHLRGVESRVRVEHGSFFEGVRAGGDTYILSHIIHNCPEAKALAILRKCTKVMTPSSGLLIVELVLSDDGTQGLWQRGHLDARTSR
jgi:hypothetical protein